MAGSAAGADCSGVAPITLLLYSTILERVRKKLVTRNKIAQTPVVLVRKFPAPLLPKMLWLELPKPMPASDLPGWSKITKTRKKQIRKWITMRAVT